jgi:hypothetical protein
MINEDSKRYINVVLLDFIYTNGRYFLLENGILRRLRKGVKQKDKAVALKAKVNLT